MIALPPPVSHIARNGKGCKSKIKDAAVQAFGRLFSQLLGCFSAN